ncbi:unnamed protein product [Echinostoma caproni]|uniref:PINc domain-containing protein n=1 Tax=Echinostoma caproni TaxID=27848 RepID=A0A183A826_9TREM|nr:unnamed protein product [Echinostoma caproni]
MRRKSRSMTDIKLHRVYLDMVQGSRPKSQPLHAAVGLNVKRVPHQKAWQVVMVADSNVMMKPHSESLQVVGAAS